MRSVSADLYGLKLFKAHFTLGSTTNSFAENRLSNGKDFEKFHKLSLFIVLVWIYSGSIKFIYNLKMFHVGIQQTTQTNKLLWR